MKEHEKDFVDYSRKGTHLSTYIRGLKEEDINFNIKWSIVDRAPPFNSVTKKCRLCLKEKWHIMSFDICDFYPSITPNLLQKALEYAESFVKISDQDKEIIFQSRKSFLFHDGKAWVKRESEDFDVAMGSFDSAEISDICGLYILSLLPCGKVSLGFTGMMD